MSYTNGSLNDPFSSFQGTFTGCSQNVQVIHNTGKRGAWRSCRASRALGRAPGATCPKVPMHSSATAPRPRSGRTRGVAQHPACHQQLQSFPLGGSFYSMGLCWPTGPQECSGQTKTSPGHCRRLTVGRVCGKCQSPKQGDSTAGQTQLGHGDRPPRRPRSPLSQRSLVAFGGREKTTSVSLLQPQGEFYSHFRRVL